MDADPAKAYIDGRIEELLDVIEKLAEHMKTHQKNTWDLLIDYVLKIFSHLENVESTEYAEWA